MIVCAFCCLLAMYLATILMWFREYRKGMLYKDRLQKKDRMIHRLIKGLPILFDEKYINPDDRERTDDGFAIYFDTRPEYNSEYIQISWRSEGRDKEVYNEKLERYFLYLHTIGLNVAFYILREGKPTGLLNESLYELKQEEKNG